MFTQHALRPPDETVRRGVSQQFKVLRLSGIVDCSKVSSGKCSVTLPTHPQDFAD
jgi:hypothetical protein